MARPRLDLPDRPNSCPTHPGSSIYVDRPTRRWSPWHESRSFRCVPPDKAQRHLMTPALVSRELTGQHPKAGLPCLHCGTTHIGTHGPTCLRGYTFTAAEIASALVNLGKGGSYSQVSADIRRGAMRKRQPGRRVTGHLTDKMQPRQPLPVRTPRSLLDMKLMAKPRPQGSKPRKVYDYSTARPIESQYVQPSRSANLAQGYVDAFAPVVLAAFPVTEWPEVVIIDSLPIKRRRIAMNAKGRITKMSAGGSQGEIYAAADGTTKPGTPILAGLEGSKDSTSVKRFLSRLPTNKEPVWVVADIDEGIRLAVEETWPNAILYRCEEHLKALVRDVLEEDGIGQWVTKDDPNATRASVKGVRVNGDFIEHRLYYRLGAALWSAKRWKAYLAAVDRIIDPEKRRTRDWLRDHTALVLRQVELRARHPGYPRSTGAIESTIRRIKKVVAERSEHFRNGPRLDRLINLVRLDTIGAADLDTYASLITKHLIARGGAGVDWHSGRDRFGTSSIDDRIERALDEHAPVALARRQSQVQGRIDSRTAEVNVWLASQGLPPIGRARQAEAVDPIYQTPRIGRTLADYPELLLQYDPARNRGEPPERFPAAGRTPVVWVCTEHRTATGGHDHIWTAPVERRTSGSRCPACAGKEVCEYTSLRHRRPDLAREWHQSLNGALTPDNVSPGINKSVFWVCLEDPDHEPYAQRISSRDRTHARCPACAEANSIARRRAWDSAYGRSQRRRSAKQRPVTQPPTLSPAELEVPLTDTGTMMTPNEVAFALGRTSQTIRNWIRDGRLRGHPPKRRQGSYEIPQSEVLRLRQILGKPRGFARAVAPHDTLRSVDDIGR